MLYSCSSAPREPGADRSAPRAAQGTPTRRGVAAAELAILVPLLTFFFLIAIDYARVHYVTVILANCARNGAMYASDPFTQARASGPYTSVEQAALADAHHLDPRPTIATLYGSDYVEVSASYTFTTIARYPGIPNTLNLKRTVRMDLAPTLPNF